MLSRTDLSVINRAHAYLVLLRVEVTRFTSVFANKYLLVSVALFLAFSPKTYCVRLLAVTLPMESGPSSEKLSDRPAHFAIQ